MRRWDDKEYHEKLRKEKSDLMDKYPLLYADRNKSMQETCMVWGLEVGPGWLPLIDEVSGKLEVLIQKHLNDNPNLECERCWVVKDEHIDADHEYLPSHPRAVQCKEKFAGLRLYLSSGTQEMHDLVTEAERKSMVTCEECGQPGESCSTGYWLKTLCDACIDDYAKDGRQYTKRSVLRAKADAEDDII